MASYEESFAIKKQRRPRLRWLKRLGWGLLILLILAVCAWAGWHHSVQQRLDKALAELDRTDPGWRLEEIEAAREQIPENENSARVVVAAARLLPKNWPLQEFDDLFAHLAPEAQLAPEDFARLKHELEKVRPALEEARELVAMPRGRHRLTIQRNPMETPLPDQQESRRVVKLLLYDALRQDQNQDMKAALKSCQAVLNTARSLGDEAGAVSQLVRMSGVREACQAIERALAQGEPPPDALAALQKLFDNEDAFAEMLILVRGERALLHGMFDAVESGDVPWDKIDVRRPIWQKQALGWFIRDQFRQAHPIMLACMTRFLDIAQLPMHEQAAAEQQLHLKLLELKESDPLAVIFLPAIPRMSEISRRKHALIRSTIAALAAECYRQTHKKWPDSLYKLCPQFLTAVPLDPFDGEPLRYRRIEDGVIIYFVGNDTIDNGGNLDREHPNLLGVDIGFRLWDVAKHRQPPRPKPPAPQQASGMFPNPK